MREYQRLHIKTCSFMFDWQVTQTERESDLLRMAHNSFLHSSLRLAFPQLAQNRNDQEGKDQSHPYPLKISRLVVAGKETLAGKPEAQSLLWGVWDAGQMRQYCCSLTTLTDVHAEEGELGAISTDAVKTLAVQPGLPLLLPQLHPADVTAAVEEVLLQSPVGKKRGEGIPERWMTQLPPRTEANGPLLLLHEISQTQTDNHYISSHSWILDFI